ncbi:hypothetical protein [Bdellovibrio bacteriovorus]|uniref:hypothetical protein n=1 Tax=Bdellovibrio bacteriovorus TaxID=959 RepID=UPI0035A6794C
MKYLLAVILLSVVVGCASSKKDESPAEQAPEVKKQTQKKAPTVSIESKQLAAEEETPFVTEFSFKKGSADLSQTAKNEIESLIKKAEKKGKIEEIKVISWADEEYPSVHTKKLSTAERNIANNRNKSIESFVNDFPLDAKVSTYSMAERPNILKDVISTSDARIKKSLETAGIPNTDTSVKVPAKASKAIVIVIVE